MASQFVQSQSFSLKGRLFTLTVLKLATSVVADIIAQVEASVAKAPALFSQAPIVLDFTSIEDKGPDLTAVVMAIKDRGLLPVAVQTKNPALSATAASIGLASLHASSSHDRELNSYSPSIPTDTTTVSTTKYRSTPVRSGQQVANKEGDLIVCSAVSPGAEVLANGNIHIYAALRGRALAGLCGDQSVRIFCQSLDAELVSIAGFYQLSDSLPQMKKPWQIYLKDEQIIVEAL